MFQKGAKINTPFFVVRAVPAWDDVARLTVVVSKKTAKSAVKRNRIRRRLFAAAEAVGFPNALSQPFRIAIVGYAEAAEADFVDLTAALKEAFVRLENWRFPPKPPNPSL